MTAIYPDRYAVLDVLRCLIRETLSTLRNDALFDYEPGSWPEGGQLTESPLFIDSLELMTVAGNVNRLFALDETGLEDYLLRRRTLGGWADLIMQAIAPEDAKAATRGLRFLTSGSTGKPREYQHEWAFLGREVKHLAERFSDRRRIICLAPRQHIYGFIFGALLPRAMDVPVLVEQDAEKAVLRGLLPGDLLVAYPLRWQYLNNSCHRFPEQVEGVTSTGPCDADLIQCLRDKGLACMHEVYGSTETAGIGVRGDPSEAFSLFPWWRQWKGDPTALTDKPAQQDSEGFSVPDLLEWQGDGHFRPVGRRDGAVQVGGINVQPEYVAERLCQHPAVAEALVRSGEDSRLKAFLVLRAEAETPLDENAMRQWMYENLPAHERPTDIRFGETLPRGALGKLADWH